MYKVSDKTKSMTFVGVLAGVYFVINILFAPISFGPLQFRIANLLQPFVLKSKKYIYAIALGTFLANLQSPFGILDWGVMPLVSIIAGHTAYYISQTYIFKYSNYLAMVVFALTISANVGWILYVGAGLPYIIGTANVFFTSGLLNLIGVYVVNALSEALERRGLKL